jgi:hypothetical protein
VFSDSGISGHGHVGCGVNMLVMPFVEFHRSHENKTGPAETGPLFALALCDQRFVSAIMSVEDGERNGNLNHARAGPV